MTAKIIQFPAPFQVPAHWIGTDEYFFDHLVGEGMSVVEAAEKIERQIEELKPRHPGENVLLRLAREALIRAPKRKLR